MAMVDERLPEGWEAIPEDLVDHARWLKHIKDEEVEGASFDDNGDIPPQLTFFRDGQVVAWGHADMVDRDRGLQMAAMGVAGFGADKVWFTTDAHMTDQRFWERYGRSPDPNELQHLCDDEGACEIGLTTDCLWCIELCRDGSHRAFSLPYHVDRRLEPLDFADQGKAKKAIRKDDKIGKMDGHYVRATKKVHWMDERVSVFVAEGNKVGLSGRVMDGLLYAFEQPTLSDKVTEFGLDPASFGLSEEEARLHLDIVGTKFLAGAGFLVALAVKDPDQLAIVNESVRRSALLRGAAVNNDHVEWIDPTPGEASLTDIVQDIRFAELRQKLLDEAREAKEQDQAEAERRRSLRVDGQPSDEDRGRRVKERHQHHAP